MGSGRTAFEVVTSAHGWSVSGEIDASNCAELAASFADLPEVTEGRIELDLQGVTFIDSSALRVFLILAERATEAGATVVVRNPAAPVARILRITHLESTFGVDEFELTPADAVLGN